MLSEPCGILSGLSQLIESLSVHRQKSSCCQGCHWNFSTKQHTSQGTSSYRESALIKKQHHFDAWSDNFVSSAHARLSGFVDILIFNPPYVVTSSEELESAKGIELSWAGGIDGRQVLDQFLQQSKCPQVCVRSFIAFSH